MSTRQELFPVASPETASQLSVNDGKVFIPMGLARDVERVAGAMVQDAETIELSDTECEIAQEVQTHLDERRRFARMQELQSVGMPVDELELVVNGAAAVIDGYHARSERHFEDKQIPQEPTTLTDRIKKAGASVTGFAIVVAGVNSPSGRSARRLRDKFTDDSLDKLLEKSKIRKKQTGYTPSLNEWSIALEAESESASASETPVY